MSKKSAVPTLLIGKPDMDRFFAAVKQNLDSITGQSRNVGKLELLPETASTADVIAKINAIIDRIQ
jgi:hypothetical protein